jgi:hypothetical protein
MDRVRGSALGALTVVILEIEAPCSKLQGIFDPQGSIIYSNRSLTPQQATGNALAPGFNEMSGEQLLRLCRLELPVRKMYALSLCFRGKEVGSLTRVLLF